MTITIETASESLDFGKSPTIKIAAFTPEDLFKLGRSSCELEDLKADFVIGTSTDGHGKYLRMPLVPCARNPDAP